MGSPSRGSCVLWPFLLTLSTLVLLIFIFIGNTTLPSSVPRALYFFKLNTSNTTLSTSTNTTLADWYTIGLWNYCSGASGTTVPTACSTREIFFHFDPLTVWDITDTEVDATSWTDALSTYYKMSKWMTIAYIVGIIASLLTLFTSLFARCCGRLTTWFVSLTSLIMAVLVLVASAAAMAIFIILKSFVADKLETYGVSSSLGITMFALTWLAGAFATMAFLMWSISLCCCSGESGRRRKRESRGRSLLGESSAYERVPSPDVGGDKLVGNTWYGQDPKDVLLRERDVEAASMKGKF